MSSKLVNAKRITKQLRFILLNVIFSVMYTKYSQLHLDNEAKS